MDLNEKDVAEFVNTVLRPKIRVDGGEIAFERLEGSKVTLSAKSQCAVCPATANGCQYWIEQELRKKFGDDLKVAIAKKPFYWM